MGGMGVIAYYLIGVMLFTFGPISLLYCGSIVLGACGALGATGWTRIPAVVVSVLISLGLGYALDCYGIGMSSIVLTVLWFFAREQGLQLVWRPEANAASRDTSTRWPTGQFSLGFLLSLPVAVACLCKIYALWHPLSGGQASLFWECIEAEVIAIVLVGIPWLCLRETLRPLWILLLVGCLWPWLSPFLFAFAFLPSPAKFDEFYFTGWCVLPLSVPMAAAVFLAMRGCGCRLVWRAESPQADCVLCGGNETATTDLDPPGVVASQIQQEASPRVTSS